MISLYGSSEDRTFDFFPFYADGAYYLFYVDQQNSADTTQPIAYATASSLYGPYYQKTLPGTDYFGWENGFRTEAPALFRLRGGCVRIVIDEWTNPPGYPGWLGRKYAPYFQDSCPSRSALFSRESLSGPRPLVISQAEHGTIIPVSGPAAYTVEAAASGGNASAVQ